jgi:hypothetical protein
MADPGWPALMDYIRRLTYVMAMGRPGAEVAVYLPSSSLWLGDAAGDVAFVSTERMLAERQIDFDIIGLNAMATDLKAGPGALETMSENKYSVVILPSLACSLRWSLRGCGRLRRAEARCCSWADAAADFAEDDSGCARRRLRTLRG